MLVFIIVLIFLTTPTSLFYFVVNQSPYLSDVTNLNRIDQESWTGYFIVVFLPPVLILGIN